MSNHGRRDVLKAMSALGALAVFRCGGSAASEVSNGACVLDPTVTAGPFWVDGRL